MLLTLIEFAWKNKNKDLYITICRKTFPALRASCMRDFFTILNRESLYNPEMHNKSEHIYKLYGNTFEFISTDQPQKVRGRKREILFMNEANEFSLEDYTQLSLRTTFKIILDYNPSDEFHWIYDKILTRNDCDFFVSTYLDNPFLEKSIVQEIERLKTLDKNYWRIYGLGERGVGIATIYNHWKYIDNMPTNYDDIVYGLDFGYNNPTALIKIYIKDSKAYLEEILYKQYLTTTDLINELKTFNIGNKIIWADSAEPKTIHEIANAGYVIKSSDKNVKKGIDKIKSTEIHIDKNSINLLKEIKQYKWKQDKNGNIIDDPVKINDHLIDAVRYGIYNYFKTDNKITFFA
ncbi:MAG TPA: PBSX family phage terminase large subunit [Flavobacteriaceae bacterium]|nr:PBSX family phage terminase large subunit [Flavobacteriaceae bacterium]